MPESRRTFRGFIQRSIFIKLFLIYAATTLALIIAVSGYSRLVLRNDEMFKQTRGRMMAHHLTALIDQLGTSNLAPLLVAGQINPMLAANNIRVIKDTHGTTSHLSAGDLEALTLYLRSEAAP